MRKVHPIELPKDEAQAFALQSELASKISMIPPDGDVRWVWACDVAYANDDSMAYAGVIVFDREADDVVARASWVGEPEYPYIPGLFAFREAAALIGALESLDHPIDVLLIDGHGQAHPRRFGVASHLGWAFDVPSIGCAKTLLCGQHTEPDVERGASAPLHDEQGDVIGSVLRTQTDVKPVFVSAGHRMDLPTANQLILSLSPKFRIPEPLRQAHLLSIELRAKGSVG